MSQPLLSFEQSPPLSVPAPFFLAAPLFAAAAGLMLILDPALFQSRWLPGTLALTHLLTLGFFALVMVGAFQQLLPVLAGAQVPGQILAARILFGAITAGTVALAVGLARGAPPFMGLAMALLGAGLGLFVLLMAWALWRSPSRHATVRAMLGALVALTITAGLGLMLASGHSGHAPLARQFTDHHAAWGAIGWIALLVMGVAWQVVPMFQLTPDYPRWLVRATVPATLLALAFFSFVGARWAALPAAVVLITFAGVTLALQRRRRRRLPDVTVAYWQLAMGALVAAVMLWFTDVLYPRVTALLPATLFFVGFGLSVVSGMLYKIVPFLVWLHLNNLSFSTARPIDVPTMKQVISEARARHQFHAHRVALLLLVAASLAPTGPLVRVAGAAFVVSALFLAFNLWSGLALYRRLRRECGVTGETTIP